MSENVDAGDWTDADEARIGMLWNAKGTIDKSKNPPQLTPPDDNSYTNQPQDRNVKFRGMRLIPPSSPGRRRTIPAA